MMNSFDVNDIDKKIIEAKNILKAYHLTIRIIF